MVEYIDSNYNGIEYLSHVLVNYVEELRTALLETQVNLNSILGNDDAGKTFALIDPPSSPVICSEESDKNRIEDVEETASKETAVSKATQTEEEGNNISSSSTDERSNPAHSKQQKQHCSCCPLATDSGGIDPISNIRILSNKDWMVQLADAWELAGKRTRQRMKLLGGSYRRLYGRHRNLRQRLDSTRLQLRRSKIVQREQQVILEKIGRQVDRLTTALLSAGNSQNLFINGPPPQEKQSALNSDRGKSNPALKTRHHRDRFLLFGGLFRRSGELHEWHSNLSTQLSWIRSWLVILLLLLVHHHQQPTL